VLADRFVNGWEEVADGELVELAVYGGDEEGRVLASLLGPVSERPVEDDWAERWREFHRPAVVGPLWIGPPWELLPPDRIAVVVEPGRAFGTGAHATTRLCLELLLEQEPTGLVDLGCGSGVLSIAAAKLGFAPVTAVDVDPAAIVACRENATRNGAAVEARLLDLRTEAPPAADLAVANIERGLVEDVAGRLAAPRLIASGYLESDAVTLPGLRRVDRRTAEGWAAELFERR
jgi:ribosomal protein L11 methyltransferase